MTTPGSRPLALNGWHEQDKPIEIHAGQTINPPIKVKWDPIVRDPSDLPNPKTYYDQLKPSAYCARLSLIKVDGSEFSGPHDLMTGGPVEAPGFLMDKWLYFKFCSLEDGWQMFTKSAVGHRLQFRITIYFLGEVIAECLVREVDVAEPLEFPPGMQQYNEYVAQQCLEAEMREEDYHNACKIVYGSRKGPLPGAFSLPDD